VGMNMGKRSGPGNWCKFDEHRSADPAATELRPVLRLGTRSLYIYKPCICWVDPGVNSLHRWREACPFASAHGCSWPTDNVSNSGLSRIISPFHSHKSTMDLPSLLIWAPEAIVLR